MLSQIAPLALACLLAAFLPPSLSVHTPTPISHDFKKPAFISFLPELSQELMTVTSFDILCSNCKLSIVNTSTMESTVLASLNWPNAVTYCPASACSKPSLLVSRCCRIVKQFGHIILNTESSFYFSTGWFRLSHPRPHDWR